MSVKADQVMHFLGEKMTPQVAQEVEGRLSTRIEGTCMKHRLGTLVLSHPAGLCLRLEWTHPLAHEVTAVARSL